MRLRSRLQRLERRLPDSGADATEPVEIWLPENGRGMATGCYPCPASNAVVVIYESQLSAPPSRIDVDDPDTFAQRGTRL